jgi:hypothetical protein
MTFELEEDEALADQRLDMRGGGRRDAGVPVFHGVNLRRARFAADLCFAARCNLQIGGDPRCTARAQPSTASVVSPTTAAKGTTHPSKLALSPSTVPTVKALRESAKGPSLKAAAASFRMIWLQSTQQAPFGLPPTLSTVPRKKSSCVSLQPGGTSRMPSLFRPHNVLEVAGLDNRPHLRH